MESETLTKVLKILGLDSEELRPHLSFPQPKSQNYLEEFKILIVVRGIIDKFSSKPRKCLKPVQRCKLTNQLQSQLQVLSAIEYSEPHRELQKLTQGNDFFIILRNLCQRESVYLNIPETVLFTKFSEPVKLWTDSQGLVRSQVFHVLDLKTEFLRFKKPPAADLPAFVLKCEHQSANKKIYQSYFFQYGQVDELLYKIQEISYLQTPTLVSSFVKFKGNLPSKTRTVFLPSGTKAYFVGAKEKIKQKLKNELCWVTKFIPSKLLDALQFSNQELELFENGLKCKVVFPVRGKSIYFEKELYELDFVKFAEKVTMFLSLIVKSALKLPVFQKFREKLLMFLEYLEAKQKKIKKFTQKFVGNPSKVKNLLSRKKQWESSQFIKVSESQCSIYQIANNKKLSCYSGICSEIQKVIKNYFHSTQQVVGCVMDLIESSEGVFLIKVVRVDFEEKKRVKLPVISSTKHISLFSATEGSGFVKGKMNKQRLCCGDYCSLLKRNDFETKEKIEFLMKHYLQYANTLFELLKLQDLLNIDTVSHLLDRQKRPTTPITQHMQYKVLRKIILEDRYDKYSLRSLILNLPNEVVRELNLILESGNENSIELHLSCSSSTQSVINKKLTWEFELVPVCDKCYKIYSKRMNN